jgi:hypothetical protein
MSSVAQTKNPAPKFQPAATTNIEAQVGKAMKIPTRFQPELKIVRLTTRPVRRRRTGRES